jgi:hypothetical protein
VPKRKKSGLDSQQLKGNISAGCFQKTTLWQGKFASVNLALTAGKKNQEFS